MSCAGVPEECTLGTGPWHCQECPEQGGAVEGASQARTVMAMAHGLTAVFDAAGQQIAALQDPWLDDLAARLEHQGVDIASVIFQLPDGRWRRVANTPEQRALLRCGPFRWEHA